MSANSSRTPDDNNGTSDDLHEAPDSTAGDETYARNEEGQPRMTSRSSGTDAGPSGGANAGTAALLILVGVLLFVFPEPVTSIAGVLLIVGGILLWSTERLV